MKPARPHPFGELPADERALIRSVLNALNRANNSEDFAKLALHHKRHDARPRARVDRTPIPDALLREMEQDAGDPKNVTFWDQYWRDQINPLREALTAVAHGEKLSPNLTDELISTFDAFVVATPVVDVSDGKISIRTPLRFKDATGAAAFAILRVAQLSVDEPAILCCEECGTFALILPSVGSRMSRFCSTTCRNRFNQRKFRAKPARHK